MTTLRVTAVSVLVLACCAFAGCADRAFAATHRAHVYGDGCGLDYYNTVSTAIECLSYDVGTGASPGWFLTAPVVDDSGALLGYAWVGSHSETYASDTNARAALAGTAPTGVDPTEWSDYVATLEFDYGTGHTADGYPAGDDSAGYFAFTDTNGNATVGDSSPPPAHGVKFSDGTWTGFDPPPAPPSSTTVALTAGDRQALDLTWFGIWLLGGIFFGLWFFRRLAREAHGWGMGA
jgi:hypothetical protein